jgi:hypothetical protein
LLDVAFEQATCISEGDWPIVPHPGHQILLAAEGGGQTLWTVEDVRHVVGMDGLLVHCDIRVSRRG